MATKSFGKTWWGQEWLNALTHIDYENRIPRGAAYARKGAVKEIKISGGTIAAKVQGTQRSPYRVQILVPPADPEQVSRLVDEVVKQPLLVSKLLNHELDPQLMNIALRVGIRLFPQSWRDLEMKCSCPDWAVPCKHLAAVVYMLSREIDNDPFLVFRMRGIDLVGQLAGRGLTIRTEETNAVPAADTLYEVEAKGTEATVQKPHPVDLTHITDIQKLLTSMLPSQPTFYAKGDFRATYGRGVGAVARRAKSILEGLALLPVADATAPGQQGSVQLLLDDELNVINLHFDQLLADVAAIEEDDLADYDADYVVVRHALNVALHLMACGAVIPKLVSENGKLYAVVWLPAMAHAPVREVVEELGAMMPPDMLRWQQAHVKKPSRLQNRAVVLLALIFNYLMPRMRNKVDPDNRIESLFFAGHKCRFGGVGEQSIPESVAAWLSHLDVGSHQFCPQLLVGVDGDDSFQVDISVLVDGLPVPMKKILTAKAYAPIRLEVLRDASMLSPFLPSVESYLHNGASCPMTYRTQEFSRMLLEVFPALRLLGVGVALPKELQNLCRPRPSVTIRKSEDDSVAHVSLAELLDFDWQVAVGDELIPIEQFQKLVAHARGLIRFKGQFFYVDENDIEHLNDYFGESRTLTPGERLQAALSESFDGVPVEMTAQVRKMMEQLRKQRRMAVPKGIKATLRPYQQRGYEWMYRNAKLGFGSIIADDMGLGKTLQVITLLQKFKDEGAFDKQHALVVVPTTLLTNWQAELSRFAPNISCRLYHGPGRTLKGFDADVLLTTYGVVRSDLATLKRRKWHTVVIDEAQNIKNATTAQSKAVHALAAANRIAMSGTPIENRMSEFWSIMDFANPQMLGSAATFRKQYANPIQREGDQAVAERFRRVTAPFLLRRLKTDRSIIADLPDKIEEDTFTSLTDQQAALYHETLRSAMAVIDEAPTDTPQALFKRQGLVLQMILSLKQICNHPALFLKDGNADPTVSGKAETLLTLLDSIVRNRQKVLVFTQFKEMGDLLVQFVSQSLGEKPLFLHGGLSVKERARMVDDFQTRPECRIFILSIKAAGTGLNLTAANHVIHYDLWWNPAVEAQATDRAYRIGQHQNVIVHRFITQGTFEEQINRMIQEKKQLADLTVAVGENWIGNLSNAELHDLFRHEA